MGIQKLSPIPNENYKKILTDDKGKVEDPCKVCGSELHFDEVASKRVAILDDNEEITGWLCPHCRTEYDNSDNIVTLLSHIMQEGES